jgi:hypothetical protein
LERTPQDLQLGLELSALSNAILRSVKAIAANENIGPLILHFDELDQGLSSFDRSRSLMLIGLILAAREIRRENDRDGPRLAAVVYLRSDLWDDLEFSDKNKISQGAALHIEWSSDAMLDLINLRLRAKLGPEANWSEVEDSKLMRGRRPSGITFWLARSGGRETRSGI